MVLGYACSSSDQTSVDTTSRLVGPDGATIQLGEVAIDIPPGALTSPQTISISRTSEGAPYGYVASSPVYRFQPEGLKFAKPATVIFNGAKQGTTVVWSSGATTFEPLPTTTMGTTNRASTMHFSRGLLATPTCENAGSCSVEGATCGSFEAICDGTNATEKRTDCTCSGSAWTCTTVERACNSDSDAGVPSDAGAGADSGDAPDGGAACQLPDAGSVDSGAYLCSRVLGTAGGNEWGGPIAADRDGNAYVVERSFPGVDISDSAVVKIDPCCNVQWSKSIAATATTAADIYGIATDADDFVYVYGHFHGSVSFGGPTYTTSAKEQHVFLAKLSSTGAHVWSKDFGTTGTNSEAWGFAVDASGSAVMSGRLATGSIDFGGGPLTRPAGATNAFDSFVAKLDASGNHVLSKRFSAGGGALDVLGLGVSPTGEIGIGALLIGSIDLGGGVLSAPNGGAVVAKLGPDGSHHFSRVYGGKTGDMADHVQFDAVGRATVTGTLAAKSSLDFGNGITLGNSGSGSSAWIARFDDQMTAQWARTLMPNGGTTSDGTGHIGSLSIDAANTTVVSGQFRSGANFGDSDVPGDGMFLARYATDGGLLEKRVIPHTSSYSAPNFASSAVDRSKTVLFTATVTDPIDVGVPVSSTGGTDAVFVRFAP
jgi:hypothetical protein